MLNGLSLFTGIGGLDVALSEWVRPVAYCEIDPYCQAVLLSRMAESVLPNAPIWDDIRTLRGEGLPCKFPIEIIYGGFPCQGISVAGLGKGLADERSGLFFEIVRLAQEIKPPFIFLENVPAITSRGGITVCEEIAKMGYDCRWCTISAASIGALHRGERWFLLAHSRRQRRQQITRSSYGDESQNEGRAETYLHKLECLDENAPNPSSVRRDEGPGEGIHPERSSGLNEELSDLCGASNVGWIIADANRHRESIRKQKQQRQPLSPNSTGNSPLFVDWENTEPPVCGVAHGLPHRVDRIRGLGNAVVPKQAKEAFKILMGLNKSEKG